jgi:TonB family protein
VGGWETGLLSSRSATAVLFLTWWALALDPAAQDRLARVRALFVAAAYEDALTVLDSLEPAVHAESVEPAEYRILCLLALGESDRARFFIEDLILKSPRHRLDPSVASPRIQATFESIRRQLLPGIIVREYAAAKASFDARDFKAALTRFDGVIALMNDLGPDPRVAALQKSAVGFRDLARAAVPADSADRADDKVGTVGGGGVYDRDAPDVVPPAPLKQVLPDAPRRSASGGKSGLLEIVIDERGRVESAVMRRPVNPDYDAQLLQLARDWQYEPARTRDGKSVKFRKLIEIYSSAP